MVSSALTPPAVRVPYCHVHQRAWVAARGQWVSLPAPPTLNGGTVTEGMCDICTVCVFQTFQAQFPVLYASAQGDSRWRDRWPWPTPGGHGSCSDEAAALGRQPPAMASQTVQRRQLEVTTPQ